MIDVMLHRSAAIIHVVNNRWSKKIFKVNAVVFMLMKIMSMMMMMMMRINYFL